MKKGQVLVLGLGILVVLTILTVSIGQRVSMALKMNRNERAALRAASLAKAGLNLAIREIIKGNWQNNQDLFKEIKIDINSPEYASVSYTITEGNQQKTIFGVVEEESKININTASKEVLTALWEASEIENNRASQLASDMLIWRGSLPPDPDTDNYYKTNLGYSCKGKPFSNIQELMLVRGIMPDDFEKVKDFITVFGGGKININTVSPKALTVYGRGIAKGLNLSDSLADSITVQIIDLRKNSNAPFNSETDISIAPIGAEERNILDSLMEQLVFEGKNFLIAVTGNVGTIKSNLAAVYNSSENNISYWHEN